jgi:hypothetical protein
MIVFGSVGDRITLKALYVFIICSIVCGKRCGEGNYELVLVYEEAANA